MVGPAPELRPHGDLPADCDRKCPLQDCSCTGGSTVLGIDASHLFVLRRAAEVLATPGGVRDRLLSLMEAHRCSGFRQLVSSEECLREEVTGPRRDPTTPAPSLAEALRPADVARHVTTYSDRGWEDLPDPVPQPWGLIFGERDRRLAVATNAAGDAEDVDPWLVSDDVDFVENLKAEDVLTHVNVWPVSTCDLLLTLHACGAITGDELEAVLEAEERHLDSQPQMQPRKRLRKEDALTRMAVRLGRQTAT